MDDFGATARRVVIGARNGRDVVRVPTTCLFEIVLLTESGRIVPPAPFPDWRARLERERGFAIEPLTADDVEEARARPMLRDPSDRLIAGTAARLGVPLLTKDERIRASGRVRTVW